MKSAAQILLLAVTLMAAKINAASFVSMNNCGSLCGVKINNSKV